MRTLVLVLLAACGGAPKTGQPAAASDTPAQVDPGKPQAAAPLQAGQAEARFAMGCFWCAESDFEHLDGVIDAVSGYAGGRTFQPTYHEVGSGSTGHAEAIRVIYDPTKVTYAQLLATFWHGIDPFDGDGQFCDQGSQYRPAIFPMDEAERKAAADSLQAVTEQLGRPVAVKLEDGGTFWVAEAYHQDFWKTNADHYQRYRMGCGRDARIQAVWGSARH